MDEASRLVAVVADLAQSLSRDALKALCDALDAGLVGSALMNAHPSPAFSAAVQPLAEALARPHLRSDELSLALRAARHVNDARPRIEVVWTGPKTDAVSVRRTDQALNELIKHAQRRLIVVSFAVYKVPNVRATLNAAAARQVAVDLVVETVESSGGKVDFDGWKELEAKGIRVWTWAAEHRPATSSGTLATLHAKCAIADRRKLLVSSANLTDFALSVNMELGLLIDRSDVPGRVARHLEALMANGVLVRVSR